MRTLRLLLIVLIQLFGFGSCEVKNASVNSSNTVASNTPLAEQTLTEEEQVQKGTSKTMVLDEPPKPVEGLFFDKKNVLYDENVFPMLDFTVSNGYDKTIVAFEIGYTIHENIPVQVVKKVKARIKPHKNYSSSFKLDKLKNESAPVIALSIAKYQVSRVVFADGTMKMQ